MMLGTLINLLHEGKLSLVQNNLKHTWSGSNRQTKYVLFRVKLV